MWSRAVYVTFLKSTEQAIINLDDDGLTLWSVALRNTLTLNSVNGAPALFDLIPRAVDLLSTNFDLLGKIINIVESYIVLDAPMVLQVCLQTFSRHHGVTFLSRHAADSFSPPF